VKTDCIADADNVAKQNVVLRIKFNLGLYS
jgi:hypothetical protein